MSLTEAITVHAQHLIDVAGYSGAAFLMALESMIVPIPSEAVMPFVGMNVATGKMMILPAIVFTTIGSLIGSLISYWLGYVGGKPLVLKVGKYLFLNEHHLDATVAFFHRRGSITVFISRFIPVVRHLISVPAGMGKMPVASFCVYTIIGATLWNSFLLWVGFKWQQHIEVLKPYFKLMDMVVVAGIVIVIVGWIVAHRKQRARGFEVEPKA